MLFWDRLEHQDHYSQDKLSFAADNLSLGKNERPLVWSISRMSPWWGLWNVSLTNWHRQRRAVDSDSFALKLVYDINQTCLEMFPADRLQRHPQTSAKLSVCQVVWEPRNVLYKYYVLFPRSKFKKCILKPELWACYLTYTSGCKCLVKCGYSATTSCVLFVR